MNSYWAPEDRTGNAPMIPNPPAAPKPDFEKLRDEFGRIEGGMITGKPANEPDSVETLRLPTSPEKVNDAVQDFIRGFKRTGERRQFDTGAHRDANEDKGRMDLLPWLSIIRGSKHFQKGAKTHGERNWEKGIPISVLLDSSMRHLAKAMAGLTDEDHITAAQWGILCAVETLERIKLGTMDAKLNDVPGLK